MDRTLVLEQIYAALDVVNSQLPPSRRLSRAPDTVIVGSGGALDSLGLVNFVLAVEEKIGDAIGRPVALLDPDLLGAEHGPFRTVDTLATHVLALTSP
jgi:acyl carrier protein